MLRFLVILTLIMVISLGCGNDDDDLEPINNKLDALQGEIDDLKTMWSDHRSDGGDTPQPPDTILQPTLPNGGDGDKPADTLPHTRIAFSSKAFGTSDIYVINVDGTGLTNLTNHRADDLAPTRSPDGKRIAFISTRTRTNILVMNSDGSGQALVTNFNADPFNPAWSPNGHQIAFDSGESIHMINVQNPPTPALFLNNKLIEGVEPAWHPAGTHIAYTAQRNRENPDIYIIDVNGGQEIRLTDHPEGDTQPAWHPSGNWIAYRSQRKPPDVEDENSEIYLTDINGNRQINLTNHPGNDKLPSWSPDGNQIVFASWREPNFNWEIYLMNADGTQQTNLTNHHQTDDTHPTWQ